MLIPVYDHKSNFLEDQNSVRLADRQHVQLHDCFKMLLPGSQTSLGLTTIVTEWKGKPNSIRILGEKPLKMNNERYDIRSPHHVKFKISIINQQVFPPFS